MNAVNKKLSVLSYEHPAEAVVFRALCLLLAIISCLYLYFVAASVLNVIARKEADASAASTQSSIGQLEQHYFTLSQSITPDEAAKLGLSPVTETNYVYLPGNAAAASLPTDNVTI
jgi:hypothetical protein